MSAEPIQITDEPRGHILTNVNVWSPDSEWIVYDTRSDPYGDTFDGRTIEVVNVRTREVRVLYRSQHGAHCGVATFSPDARRVAFILGPENPTPEWSYNAWHRQGIIVNMDDENLTTQLDARDVSPPFTPGALRGGSHVHVFSGDGDCVSFTYEDHILATAAESGVERCDLNQRNIGVSAFVRPVRVPKSHPRNHDGSTFSVLVTRTVDDPRPGSDEISRAFEEAWVGSNGYRRPDGTRQLRALAFQGHVVTPFGQTIAEAFLVDIPDDITVPGNSPLEGTETTRPAPPRGTIQRRLTFTSHRKFPGLQGPRHWLRSSPDGSRIAFLMRDDDRIVQLWTISPSGGAPTQVTRNAFDIASAFTWSPSGRSIAYIADNSVFVTDVATCVSTRLTARCDGAASPLPQACVFSPDRKQIAFVRPVKYGSETWNQIFVVSVIDTH
jgi:Tol biopolymer transport system component